MSRFALPLELRQDLCRAGFHGVDAALRAAAVELDCWKFLDGLHMEAWSDGGFRHYTNFLAWSETTAGGIHRAIKSTGDQSLKARWDDLWDEPMRQQFHTLRNEALKARQDVAPWRVHHGEGTLKLYRGFDKRWPGDVTGQSTAYLCWLRDTAIPLLLEAIDLDARGDVIVDGEFPIEDQMPFPHTDPWTTASDPEVAALIGFDLEPET